MKVWMFVALASPKYWLYLAGLYVVGTVLGSGSIAVFTDPSFWALLVFFTFPANMWLFATEHYGNSLIDDLSPEDVKKTKLPQSDKKTLRLWVTIALVMFGWLLFLPMNMVVKTLLILFMLLPLFHNIPPLLLKRRFLLDVVSSLVYILPGIIGFVFAQQIFPSLLVISGWLCWHIGLFMFSRLVESKYSRQAKQSTVEVLGTAQSVVSIFLVWLLASIILVVTINWRPWIFFSFLYPLLALLPLVEPRAQIGQIARMLPFINAFLGICVYWLVVMRFF
jgi:hypothetical protein